MSEQMYSLSQLLAMLGTAGVAAAHLFTAALSRVEERRYGHLPFFSTLLVILAWATLTLGLSMHGFGRSWQPIMVAAPLISGFMGPALYLHCRQLLLPGRALPMWTLLAGFFGTSYAVAVVLLPGGLDFLQAYLYEDEHIFHPIFSTLFALHTSTLFVFCLASGWLVFRSSPAESVENGASRETIFWLKITLGVGLGMLVSSNILPLAGHPEIARLTPFATLPIAFLGLKTLRVHTAEAQSSLARQASIRLQRLESLGRMARGIAHEVNNVLTGVLGNVELAKRQVDENSSARVFLGRAEESARGVGGVMQVLLTLSGRQDLGDQRCLPSAVLSEVAAEAGDRVEFRGGSELPAVPLAQKDLRQVLSALLKNAIEAEGDLAPDVPILLEASVAVMGVMPRGVLGHDLQGKEVMAITVHDHGCGMDEHVSSQVMEPFFSTKDQDGMGLLRVAAKILPRGGALSHTSLLGRGTSWTLWLPVLPAASAASQFGAATLSGSWSRDGGEASVDPADSSQFRRPGPLLVVDDNEDLLEMMEGMLGAFGFDCSPFASGESAWSFAQSEEGLRIQVALVDVRMPGMDGVELAGHLLALPEFQRIVLISGDEPGPRMVELAIDGRVSFLRKPFDFDELRMELLLRKDRS